MTYHALMQAASLTPDYLNERIAYAVVHYARYVLGASQDSIVLSWARAAIRDPFAQAKLMVYAVVADPGYPNAKTDDPASDEVLRGIVETLVNAEFKNV